MYKKAKIKRSPLKGQGLAEYATVLALITVVCVAAVSLLGNNIRDFLLGFAQTVQNVRTAPSR